MKVLVTGVNGQLGHDVMNELAKRGIEGIGSDLKEKYIGVEDDSAVTTMPYVSLDIVDDEAVIKVIRGIMPDAVIHCAAWTAVDDAEIDKNKDKVLAINAVGTSNIAKACVAVRAKLLYVSTDYVFNGTGIKPWQPYDTTCPVNFYGNSKLKAEKFISEYMTQYYIVRTAWAFGANGNNFVKTMLSLGKKYDTLRVVDDQIGTPTYTYDLARLLVDMIETDKYGIYHATNEGGYISWADFAKEIFKLAGYSTKVVPVSTLEYGLSKAKRPLNSRLDKSCLLKNGFCPLPSWQNALARYINDLECHNVI
ncbi:MAG: dTDP-4-dehydrorhamnose reductase [Phascolarctobacterium sp.]|nr:dTDP-4-dehydrorhamnose reductase [Phascolarctobacterium sp.]